MTLLSSPSAFHHFLRMNHITLFPSQYNLRPRKNIILTELTDKEDHEDAPTSDAIYTPPRPPILPELPLTNLKILSLIFLMK